MAFGSVDDHHYDYEPQLSLSNGLRWCCSCREKEPQVILPFLSSVSIPFQWEEAPGRPRVTPEAPSNATVPLRRLDLPPGFLPDGAKFTIIPAASTTSMVDGPHIVGRTLSLARSFSFRKGKVKVKAGSGKMMAGRSARWTSSLDDDWGSLDISYHPPIATAAPSSASASKTKRPNFVRLSTMASNLWGEIYGSFKLAVAVPWRRAS